MSSSASATTVESSRLRKLTAKAWTLYRFSSNWEYVVLTMACTFTYQNLKGFIITHHTDTDSNIIHYIVCYLLVGLPLNYLQILMGQYSQLGAIFFKHMSPIGHGIGYAFLLNSFVWCCHYGIIMGDSLMYLMACIDSELNWMVCPNASKVRCWDMNYDCKKNCIGEDVDTSAYVYWKESYMQDPNLNPERLTLGKPVFVRLVPLVLCWVIIYFLIHMGINKYKDIIRICFYIMSVLVLILIPVCFVAEGAGKGIELMFHINPRSFLNPSAWSNAIHTTLQLLGLCRVCHVTYGSYMTPNMPSDILTIFSVLLNFLATFLAATITHASIGITMHEAQINKDDVKYIWKDGHAFIFTVTAQGLGYMKMVHCHFLRQPTGTSSESIFFL